MLSEFLLAGNIKESLNFCWDSFKEVYRETPLSHRLPYFFLFLYPILVLQVKSGGSAMLGLLLFSGIYMLVKEKVRFDIKPILPLYFCFVFFWFVDFVTAGLAEREPVAGMLSSFTQIHFLIFPLLYVVLRNMKYSWPVFLGGMSVSLVICAVLSIIQYYNTGYGRVSGGINAIAFSSFILIYAFLILGFSVFKEKSYMLLFFGLSVIPICLSQTLGVIFSVPMAIWIFVAFFKNELFYIFKTPGFFLVSFLVGFLIVVGAIFFSEMLLLKLQNAWYEILSIWNNDFEGSSTAFRWLMWRGGVELGVNNFFLGVGRENVNVMLEFTSAYNAELDEMTKFTHLHNEYVTSFAGSGIFGVLSLILVLVAPIFIVRKAEVSKIYIYAVVLVCGLYACFGMTNLIFDNGTMNGLFVVVLALALSRTELKV